jgi:hypothetical protein
MINWIVVECAGLAVKCGALSALAPRRDVAYFVNEKTAERDAKAFAEYKNAQAEGRLPAVQEELSAESLQFHAPYAWDHQLFSPLLRWGVLEWNGADGEPALAWTSATSWIRTPPRATRGGSVGQGTNGSSRTWPALHCGSPVR